MIRYVYLHQTKDNLINFSLKINNSATLGKIFFFLHHQPAEKQFVNTVVFFILLQENEARAVAVLSFRGSPRRGSRSRGRGPKSETLEPDRTTPRGYIFGVCHQQGIARPPAHSFPLSSRNQQETGTMVSESLPLTQPLSLNTYINDDLRLSDQ